LECAFYFSDVNLFTAGVEVDGFRLVVFIGGLGGRFYLGDRNFITHGYLPKGVVLGAGLEGQLIFSSLHPPGRCRVEKTGPEKFPAGLAQFDRL
jgi:hypothetical protein